MVVSKIVKGMQCPDLFINGSAISIVTEVKYLGYIIDANCDDDSSILNTVRALYTRGNALKRVFKECTLDVKVKLFQSYCFLWVFTLVSI